MVLTWLLYNGHEWLLRITQVSHETFSDLPSVRTMFNVNRISTLVKSWKMTKNIIHQDLFNATPMKTHGFPIKTCTNPWFSYKNPWFPIAPHGSPWCHGLQQLPMLSAQVLQLTVSPLRFLATGGAEFCIGGFELILNHKCINKI